MNETDRTIVGLLWHENIIDPLNKINTNESKLSLTLGEIRTIQVSVIGAMKSGKYNVSAMSNILSVITEAGGPNEIGSFRAIELIRNNKVETVVQGKPKDNLTSNYRDFQQAVNEGYTGNFMQYQKELKREGAPKVSVDLNDPTAVAKAQLETMNKW
jgi:protein involved in polysaccharide export with SLBB domain